MIIYDGMNAVWVGLACVQAHTLTGAFRKSSVPKVVLGTIHNRGGSTLTDCSNGNSRYKNA